jgi:16S rRNA (adenine1518-N6/adenine1519-N6)-dimethyltransferase
MSRQNLGQHFLMDRNWQERIVSHFSPSGQFMEIGPGRGALTQHLKNRFSNFWVCEVDENLALTHKRQVNYRTLSLDFLKWDFSLEGRPVEKFSFIGNLPYESGSRMLLKICERTEQVEHFVFLFQKEVVERLLARPGTREFGSLTVIVQGQFDVEALDVIPPECFEPRPKVLSQLIRGRRRADAHSLNSDYLQFLRRSFLQKRKMLKNVWRALLKSEKVNEIFSRHKLPPKVRAEEIPVDVWPKIFEDSRA